MVDDSVNQCENKMGGIIQDSTTDDCVVKSVSVKIGAWRVQQRTYRNWRHCSIIVFSRAILASQLTKT